MADRDKPQASCSEWHGDGTVGEDARASAPGSGGHQLDRRASPLPRVVTCLVGQVTVKVGSSGSGRRYSYAQQPPQTRIYSQTERLR